MPHETDDHPASSGPAPDGSYTLLRPRKPWRAPLIITATLAANTDKPYYVDDVNGTRGTPIGPGS
jgi:hypothetical protein